MQNFLCDAHISCTNVSENEGTTSGIIFRDIATLINDRSSVVSEFIN